MLFRFAIIALLIGKAMLGQAQVVPASQKWGVNDTIVVQAVMVNGESFPYSELPEVFISKLPYDQMVKVIAEYNRLRNAVRVTYPFALLAGNTINDINARLIGINQKAERKKIIKSREKDLRKQFTEPLTDLSVYQGRVLMKLINRQTGNNCYEIIKEYKGGVQARMYQTVAFFFGSNLKQPFDNLNDATDRQIEAIVQELNGAWYHNSSKPGIRAVN